MTASRDPDRRIHGFVAEGEFELPDRVYDAVRAKVDASARRGGPGHRRVSGVSTRGKVAVAAAVVLSIGVASLGLMAGGVAGPSPVAPSSQEPSLVGPSLVVAPDVRSRVNVDGLPISVRIPSGWERFDPEYPAYITKSSTGPQGAEAQVFWTTYPTLGPTASECFYFRDRDVEASLDALADAVSSVPGTLLTSGPAEVTVDGRRAIRVVFVLEDDVGCDPGFFFTYPSLFGGALWPETMPGDTVRVWLVEASPRLLFLEGKTHPDAGPVLEGEVQQIIDSVRFE